MGSLLCCVIVLIMLNLLIINVCGDLTCESVGDEKWISGMRGHKQYEKYNRNCITSDIILRYIRCFIDGIMLNATRFNQMFPKVKALYWQCKGYCSISNPIASVHVYGCGKSKYFSFFNV